MHLWRCLPIISMASSSMPIPCRSRSSQIVPLSWSTARVPFSERCRDRIGRGLGQWQREDDHWSWICCDISVCVSGGAQVCYRRGLREGGVAALLPQPRLRRLWHSVLPRLWIYCYHLHTLLIPTVCELSVWNSQYILYFFQVVHQRINQSDK